MPKILRLGLFDIFQFAEFSLLNRSEDVFSTLFVSNNTCQRFHFITKDRELNQINFKTDKCIYLSTQLMHGQVLRCHTL